MSRPRAPRLRSVYRSAEGQHAVQDWCSRRLDRWTVPHIRGHVCTGAGITHVVNTGSGPPTVVVVPGTNANAALYELLAAVLAPRWPTMLLDLPGQPGLSAGDRPSRDRCAWYGRWLADVLAQMVTQPVIVIGHSLGGAIVLACDSPYIGGRLLVSTAGLARTKITPAVLGATLPWMLRPTPTRSSALVSQFLAPGHRPPPSLVDWYTLIARHTRSSLAPPVLPTRLLTRRTSVACIVATGRHDVFLPPERLQRPAVQQLNTRLRVIPGAGHLVTDEQPECLVPLLEEILPAMTATVHSGPGCSRRELRHSRGQR
jgi:pimeloyl-ACP methyl ester carboxylesterase